MAILKIARMGHPVLLKRAEEIPDPTAPEIRRLAADMAETLADAGGAGLAGPQVHASLRIILFQAPPSRGGDTDPRAVAPLTVLINPEIEALGTETEEDWEGCLSLPELMGRVPRARHIRYRGLGPDGAVIAREATGFHARVVQHEFDHLEGILYPRRLADPRAFIFESEIRFWMKQG